MLKHAVAAATLAMSVLLMVGGPAQALSVGGPRYAPGDSWTYDITGGVTSPPGISPGSFDLSISGTRTERVTAITGAKPSMTEEANLRMTTTSTFQGTTSTLLLDVHATSTMTAAGMDGAFFVNVSSQGGYFSSTQSFRGTLHVTSAVLQDSLVYPLESGHKYTTVARQEATLNLGSTFLPFTFAATTSTDYVALDSKSVTLKAGTFNTLPLATWANATDLVFNGRPYSTAGTHGNLTMKYFAPDVGNYVKTVSYDGMGRELIQEELSSYSYGSGPNRALQIFSEPYFWLSMVGIAAAPVLVTILVVRRRRVPAVPPPPTDTGAMVGSQGPPSPPPPARDEPSAAQPPVQPSEPSQEEERPPSGPP